ncbi:hypothetical protein, partial [Burkholderia alba]|uniref:hypothetical protein n=1 Tax=Burkholderia alba TaxID=2683677 RepID=UPI002B05FCF4
AAAPAFAVTVSRADGQPMNPNGEPFTATGATNLNKGVSAACTATFSGTITASGIVQITTATFAGGNLCGAISAVTPWNGQADTTTQLSINNAAVNVQLLGSCGPSKIVTAFNGTDSSLTFNNATLSGGCTVNGTVNTSPKFLVK